jgi:hypothetical protein
MNYISLGPTCSIAYQLQKLGKKKESLPFDWIRCYPISSVLHLIQNNFSDLLDDIEYVKDDTKFPFIEDNEGEDESKTFDTIEMKDTKIYKNDKLGISFFHDFKEGIDVKEVMEKYQRRIDRFYNVVKNPSVFIRDELNFKVCDIMIYNELYKKLKEFNNENRLILIINTFKKDFVLDRLNKGIEIYRNADKISEWQHPEITSILKEIVV